MPTYAYACSSCGHRFDAVQSFTDASLTDCPECGGALRKQYGTIGVTFNGPGFYRTDSRSGAGAKTDASTSSKTESTKTESTKTESTTSAAPAPASTTAST